MNARILAALMVFFSCSLEAQDLTPPSGLLFQDTSPSPSDSITGDVLRTSRDSAEISINLNHGLYTGQKVDLLRNGRVINTLTITLVDTQQAVAQALDGHIPQFGDKVIFHRPRPSRDLTHPANGLIGKRAIVSLNYVKPGVPRDYSVRILGVTLNSDGNISRILVGDDALHTKVYSYDARHIDAVVIGVTKYVRSPIADELWVQREFDVTPSSNQEQPAAPLLLPRSHWEQLAAPLLLPRSHQELPFAQNLRRSHQELPFA